ncbi:MAG: hypothetical protein V4557_17215 [Bacteroidota bacterium]
MQNKPTHIVWLLCAAALMCSCASRKVFSTNYYTENEKTLTSIEQLYKNINQQKHFSIAFTDKSFEYISLEILTDSIKYIYEFNIKEPRLQDTLLKYGLPVKDIADLVTQMSSIRCIWINNLDYYVNGQKRSLVFMSIRHVAINLPFTSEKYYILTFYAQPQYFDSEGRLLAGRRLRKLRIINGDVFQRINDKVCYTVSERFR